MDSERLIDLSGRQSTFLAIRDEYLAICNGDACAAALLDYFEQFTLWKRDKGYADWQWVYVSQSELPERLRNIWGVTTIKARLGWLQDAGLIDVRQNAKYKYDRRLQYRFAVEAVAAALRHEVARGCWHQLLWYQVLGRLFDTLLATHRVDESDQSMSQKRLIDESNLANGLAKSVQCESLESLHKNLSLKIISEKSSSSAVTDAVWDAEAKRIDDDDDGHTAPEQNHVQRMIVAGPINVQRTVEDKAPESKTTEHPPAAVVRKFEANIGAAGDQIKAGMAAAVALYGEQAVLDAIGRAAIFGGRSWAYVDSVLQDDGMMQKQSLSDGMRFVTGKYGAYIQH